MLQIDELAHNDVPVVDMYRTIVNALFIGALEDIVHHHFNEAYLHSSVRPRNSRREVLLFTQNTSTRKGGNCAN